jgi:hypothetical protein
LNEFYQFLFNKEESNQIRLEERPLKNAITHKFKVTDERFNTQMLTNLKAEFNKKIFDIKHTKK